MIPARSGYHAKEAATSSKRAQAIAAAVRTTAMAEAATTATWTQSTVVQGQILSCTTGLSTQSWVASKRARRRRLRRLTGAWIPRSFVCWRLWSERALMQDPGGVLCKTPRTYYTFPVLRYDQVPAGLQSFLRSMWEAAVATFWTFVLMRYIVVEFVFSYAAFYGNEPRPDQLESLTTFASGVGAALLLALLVARGSSRATCKDPRRALERGALIGMASVALLHSMIAVCFPPVDPVEVALHLPAALIGGLLGAAHGRRRYAVVESGYRARLALARSRHCEDIVAAIGENLLGDLGKTGAVLLWRVPPDEETDCGGDEGSTREPVKAPAGVAYELCATWPTLRTSLWPIGLRLAGETADAFAALPEGRLHLESVRRLPGVLQRLLLPLRSALVAHLSTGGDIVGLLMVVLPRQARSVERACLDASPLAAQQLTIFRQEERAERAGVRGERERLADEIHDTVIQGCIAVGNRIEDVRGVDRLDAEDRKELALALKISRDTVEEARLFIRALNTDDFSRELPQLLAAEVRDFREETDIRVQMVSRGDPFPLPPNVGVALFKAAREGLTNVSKHARATSADVVLTYGSSQVSLEIRDCGIGPKGLANAGPEPEAGEWALKKHLTEGGHGLKAMRRLVRNAGGSFSVEGIPGEGTTLLVRFDVRPVSPPEPSYSETPAISTRRAPAAGGLE
jgi:signal transduction histidine kinase